MDLIIPRRMWTRSLPAMGSPSMYHIMSSLDQAASRCLETDRIEMSYFHKIRHYLSCRKVQTLYVVNSQASCDHFESLKMPEIRSECSYVSHCPWIQSWWLINRKMSYFIRHFLSHKFPITAYCLNWNLYRF